jgi:hypothetical protein
MRPFASANITSSARVSSSSIALYQELDTPPVFWLLLHEGKNILYPEFAVLRGDLLVALQQADAAERSFAGALVTARGFGLRTPQLHAARRLRRLWRGSGQQRQGVELLQGAYASFTEGFDSRELEEARVALDQSDDRVA